MVKRILRQGSNFFTRQQKTILSAAIIIMVTITASRLLGLVRNRVLANFFSVETLSIYFAAFRIPETIFEILVFGTFSSAFIPTFTSYISKNKKQEAWYVAAVSLNFALLFFTILAIFIFFTAQPLYKIIAPGFNPQDTAQIANLSRILLLAQGFFVLSYFLTSVLESLQRFLVPALAPLLYNLGIILGAVFLSSSFGIYAPAIGAVLGAFLHFLIQLPLAFWLGFRPKLTLNFSHPGVREIGRLALPRIIELSSIQVGKMAELFLASLVSTAAYTYYTFANSLALVPIGLFGISLGKASLPTLSYQAARENRRGFAGTIISLLNQVIFFILPCALFLAVLRIPVVRLVFGASRFTWESTVQTGYTVSAFGLGILAQALLYPLTRAFWAFHDTKTPVQISVGTILIEILLGAIFILVFKLQIWTLALAFSLASLIQVMALLLILLRRLPELEKRKIIVPFLKIALSSFAAASLMFFFLKILDRSAWDKRLSFLGWIGLKLPISFDRFVLDTHYTFNLLLLTILVGLIGLTSYLFLSWVLKVKEVAVFKKLIIKIRRPKISPETIALPPE